MRLLHRDCTAVLGDRAHDGLLRFDLVDLDPFGSSLPFLQAAIRGSKHGALIGATFTDLKVVEGFDYKKLYSLYGCQRGQEVGCKEEVSLRLVLASINAEANKMSKTIRPLLSVWKHFYMRVLSAHQFFFEVVDNRSAVQQSLGHLSSLYSCPACKAHHLQPHMDSQLRRSRLDPAFGNAFCADCCKNGIEVTGPLWSGSLNDLGFVTQIKSILEQQENEELNARLAPDLELGEAKLIGGILQSILNEDVLGRSFLFDWDLADLFSAVKCPTPSRKLI